MAQKTIGSDGCAARANYLLSETHENHVRSGTKIIHTHGKPKEVATNSSLRWSEANQLKFKHGGRPNYTFGMEYMLSPPKGYNMDKEQGQRLVRSVLKAIAPKLGVDYEELKDLSYSSIHKQDNDHLNIWFATITNDGTNIYSKGLSRPSITNTIRRTFNDFCLKEYGLNIENFVPEKASLASENWQRINDEKKQLAQERRALNKREETLIKKENKLKDLREKLPKQIQKWIEYLNIDNKSRAKSTEKRIIKTLSENINSVEIATIDKLKDQAENLDRKQFSDNLEALKDKNKPK
jgi:gas vesicle protein